MPLSVPFNWMAIGLAVTGLVAYYVAHSETILRLIFQNRMILYGLFIGEVALVFYLSARINRLRASTATGLFLFYAFLNGLTLSIIFLIYSHSSIAATFFICAGTFAASSVFGWVTRRDLTGMGNIGVIVFVGLTAYDTQKIKTMAMTQPADIGAGVIRKGAIMGALHLYLDFVNLFLMMVRIFGGGRD